MIELLILYILSEKELSMYAILKQIIDSFGAYTQPSFGAIKPALTRLEKSNMIRSRKAISEGGKLSGFYSITKEGREELNSLLLEKTSSNPLQFNSMCAIKLSCSSYLNKEDRKTLFFHLKSRALEHKITAKNILNNEKNLSFYQKIILDNTVVEYKNLVTLIDNLEKENERNS